MKTKNIKRTGMVLLVILLSIIGIFFFGSHTAARAEVPTVEAAPLAKESITSQQEVWIYALQWCESRGVDKAINPKDRDGTPSYGAFQFKPGTMMQYGIKYGLWNKDTFDDDFFKKNILMDAELQREIVGGMINDPTTVWTQQFPDCVKNHIGKPPIK